MIDKVFITGKLENFFRQTNPESFLKVFIISFLFDKINYILYNIYLVEGQI